MEVDILNYSPTVMFHGTPCIYSWELTRDNSWKRLDYRYSCEHLDIYSWEHIDIYSWDHLDI